MRGNSVRPLAAKEAEALFQLCLWLQVTVVKWNMRAHPDLNQGPADLQSAALTTELCTQVLVGVSRSNKLQTVLPKKGPESRSTTTNLRRLKPSSTQAVSVATGRPKGKSPRGRGLWGCVKKPSALWRMKFSSAGDCRKETKNMSWLTRKSKKRKRPFYRSHESINFKTVLPRRSRVEPCRISQH